MGDITISCVVNQSQRFAMQTKLNNIFSSKNIQNLLATELLYGLRKNSAINKFLTFVSRNDFAGYFGMPGNVFKEMNVRLDKAFTYEELSKHSKFDIGYLQLSFGIMDENYLRSATFNVWDNLSKNSHPPILVNAWDVLEYGIIGGSKVQGIIKDYQVTPAIGWIQKNISRSRMALMRKHKGQQFVFSQLGGAPQINEIRSSLVTSGDKIGNRLVKRIREFIRTSNF